MDIFEKAKELGTMISQSAEMTKYKDSEAKMQADQKSTTLMKEYNQLQVELVKLTRSENPDGNEMQAAKDKLLAKQDEISNYDITSNFLASKSELEALMKKVNDIIIFSITGEPTCSDDHCKTCGGGCRG
jgi:cell fate (sporulation/competence/biofilm development) regulator YlbF (YheA/YmcA/DUF963 family)